MKKYTSEEDVNLILTESKNYTDLEIAELAAKLNELKVETWTFTLDNGSTVTKQVVVK